MSSEDLGYEGPERRKSVESAHVLKVWHFVVSQIGLFVMLLGFMFGFSTWGLAQLQQNFYPASKGLQLEESLARLNESLDQQNLILTDLRLFIARNVKEGR